MFKQVLSLTFISISFAATIAHAENIPVRVATLSTSLAHGPLALAMADPSIFAEQGIDLAGTVLAGNSANCIAALLSSSVELCQVGTTVGTDAIAEGADLVAVAVLTGPVNELFLSRAAAEATGVSPDAPIEERIRALKGLAIATSAPGSAHYLTLAGTLEKAGLSLEDITYQSLTDVPAMIESVRNGRLDGAMWTIGSLSPLLMDESGVRWISMARGDVQDFATLPYVAAYARRDWVNENPEIVAQLHAGYASAIHRLQHDGARASVLVKDMFFPDLDQALWDDGFAQAQGAYLPGARVSAASWQQSLDMQTVSTGKDYTAAGFEIAVHPLAQAEQ